MICDEIRRFGVISTDLEYLLRVLYDSWQNISVSAL